MAYPVGPLRQTTEGFEPMISHFFVGHYYDIICCMRICFRRRAHRATQAATSASINATAYTCCTRVRGADRDVVDLDDQCGIHSRSRAGLGSNLMGMAGCPS